ncbi:MAG: hypothetical protein M3Y17_01355 [Actinomycetota bacterium]|nr:hypothetical protein [Actinomycetota bacterium]
MSRHIDALDLARGDRLRAQQLLGDGVDAHSVGVRLGVADGVLRIDHSLHGLGVERERSFGQPGRHVRSDPRSATCPLRDIRERERRGLPTARLR